MALASARGRTMALAIVVAGVSDVYDGKIARRFGVDTARVRRFDSISDTVFYAGVAIALWIVHPEILRAHAVYLGAFILMQVVGHIIDVIKFGRDTSYHSWSGRALGLALFVATGVIFGTGSAGPWLVVALLIGMLAHLDAFVITMILPEWRHDVHTIAEALAIRRGLLNQPQTRGTESP